MTETKDAVAEFRDIVDLLQVELPDMKERFVDIAIVIYDNLQRDKRMAHIDEQRQKREQYAEYATEKQKDYLKKLGVKFNENITKQEASSLIEQALREVSK